MKCILSKFIFSFTILFFLFLSSPYAFASDSSGKKTEGEPTLLNRIDFGNAYIMGQSIKSGAVYLLQRKKSEIKSMLYYRKDYRNEILEDFEIHEPKENADEEHKIP